MKRVAPTRAECQRASVERGAGHPRLPSVAQQAADRPAREAAQAKERERRRKAATIKRKLDKLLVAAEAAIVEGHDHLAWTDLYTGPDSEIGRTLWPADGSTSMVLGWCEGDDGDLYKRKVEHVEARSFAAAVPTDTSRVAAAERRAQRVENWHAYMPGGGEPVLRP